jgi:sulfatase maturation enzyme AslB (radical SAM superfamily)
MEGILRAWGTILTGRRPCLSIEVTRECPLSCPGCYAYGKEHLGDRVTLRDLSDYRQEELVDRILALVRAERPLHVSLVGGEPLVRFREMSAVLPELSRMGIWTQLVTSAVRPIPREWATLRRVKIVVSIDGLQAEHDARRKPATYDRILKHIEGQHATVHWTVTRQQMRRDGYLEELRHCRGSQATTQPKRKFDEERGRPRLPR